MPDARTLALSAVDATVLMHGVLQAAGAPACRIPELSKQTLATANELLPESTTVAALVPSLPRAGRLMDRVALIREVAREQGIALHADQALYLVLGREDEWLQRLAISGFLETCLRSEARSSVRRAVVDIAECHLRILSGSVPDNLLKSTVNEIIDRARQDVRSLFPLGEPLLPWLEALATRVCAAVIMRTAVSEQDSEAIWKLLEPHRGWMLGRATRLLGPADAEDLVQETYVQILQGARRFRGDSSLKTWLRPILALTGHGMRQQRNERQQVERHLDEEALAISAEQPDPLAPPLTYQFLQFVQAELSANHYQVALRKLHGETVRAIAERLGLKPTKVQTLWQECRTAFLRWTARRRRSRDD